eukprot:m.4620 g.4620  ORF g.4620 m.4620 type:complete len:55 (-) comp3030_c0_seq1:428-592(-)
MLSTYLRRFPPTVDTPFVFVCEIVFPEINNPEAKIIVVVQCRSDGANIFNPILT